MTLVALAVPTVALATPSVALVALAVLWSLWWPWWWPSLRYPLMVALAGPVVTLAASVAPGGP